LLSISVRVWLRAAVQSPVVAMALLIPEHWTNAKIPSEKQIKLLKPGSALVEVIRIDGSRFAFSKNKRALGKKWQCSLSI
jgi:hypothetical protein